MRMCHVTYRRLAYRIEAHDETSLGEEGEGGGGRARAQQYGGLGTG